MKTDNNLNINLLASIESIVDTIRNERNSEQLLDSICGKVLRLFGCDRAWLLYPCDPEAPSWSVPVERTVPAYPGANLASLSVLMTADVAEIFQTALDSEQPVVYGPEGLPLAENTKSFQVKSQLSMAITPHTGKPWQFGIHQCSYDRVWSEAEIRLFKIIGVMMGEALGNILLVRDLQKANDQLETRVSTRTAELNAEKELADILIETAQAIVLVLDQEGKIVRFNRYLEQLSGYRLADVVGEDWFQIFFPPHEKELAIRSFQYDGQNDSARGHVHSIVTKDGAEKIIEWYGKALPGTLGRTAGLLAVGHDVTERTKVEQQTRTALDEKSLLLKEIHHRVKNNMQIVSSLIGIQRSQLSGSADSPLLDAFLETQNRIKSMALVHEKLYKSSDFAHVDFAQYIKQLAKELTNAYGIRPDFVSLATRVERSSIDINHAIPCGLIVNELLTNAFKHAFPAGRSGTVGILLRKSRQQYYRLVVCDNGVGLPEELDIATAKTTGMVIVNALIRQLRGNLVVVRDNGACFKITFRVT